MAANALYCVYGRSVAFLRREYASTPYVGIYIIMYLYILPIYMEVRVP